MNDRDYKRAASAMRQIKIVEGIRRQARTVSHVDPTPAIIRRRTRLEKDLAKWIRFFFRDATPLKFSDDHLEALQKIETAIRTGGMFALAMSRGSGKTTLLRCSALFAVLTGSRRYIVFIGATQTDAEQAIDFIRRQLRDNERLAAYYPHVTTYCQAAEDKALRAKYQLRSDGQSSGLNWSKSQLQMPAGISDQGASGYPSDGAIIEAAGLTGSIRGKAKDSSGKVIRPDLVVLDDPSTRESAESAAQCSARERIISGDILALAGPRRKIAAVACLTIIKLGDLADRLLDREMHPEFSGSIYRLVKKWPDAQETLWKQYAELYREGLASGNTKRATMFYKEHRDAMDAGAQVSWPARRRDGELSALQTAQNLKIEMGEQAFHAEMQNEPIKEGVTLYTLTPEVICSRATDRKPGAVPDWVKMRVAATDINPSYGLTWALLGFGADQTAAVLVYGIHPMSIPTGATEGETAKAVYEALTAHGKNLAVLPCRPEYWLVDAGGSAFDTAIRFAANSARVCGLQAIAATGRGARNYRAYGKSVLGRPREQCHTAVDVRGRKWVAWNADYWREIAQKGWTGSIGAPGSCSLPAGSHREFAEQICREQLAGKSEVGGQMVWIWNAQPGAHDYGDCMAMAYMGAAYAGIGTGGGETPARRPLRRRIRHIAV